MLMYKFIFMEKKLIYLLFLFSIYVAIISNLSTQYVYAFDFTRPLGEYTVDQNVGYPKDYTVYCEEVFHSGSSESSLDINATHWTWHEEQSCTTYSVAKTATDCIIAPYNPPFPSCTPYNPCK